MPTQTSSCRVPAIILAFAVAFAALIGLAVSLDAAAPAIAPAVVPPGAAFDDNPPAGCYATDLDLVHANAKPNSGHLWPDVSAETGSVIHLAGTAQHYSRGSDCSIMTTPVPFTWNLTFQSPSGQVSDLTGSLSNQASLSPDFSANDEGTYLVQLSTPAGINTTKFNIKPSGMQWINIGPNGAGDPFTGRVNAIAFDPRISAAGTMYIGAAGGGVWKSTDYGSNWRPMTDNKGLPDYYTTALAVSSDGTVYVSTGDVPGEKATGSDGIYKSADGGLTWQSTLGPGGPGCASFNGPIWSILKHPTDPNILFAAGQAGLKRTTNGGSCWQSVPVTTPGFGPPGFIRDIAFKPGDPNTLYAISADVGVLMTSVPYVPTPTWTVKLDLSLAAPLIRGALGVSAANPALVYADYVSLLDSTSQAKAIGIARSTDSGGSWEFLPLPNELLNCSNANQCDYNFALAVNPLDANDIFHGDSQLWRFRYPAQGAPGVANWQDWGGKGVQTPGAVGMNKHADVHAIVYDPFSSTRLFEADDGGVGLYDLAVPSRGSWAYLNNGLSIGQFSTLAVRPSAPNTRDDLAAGAQDNGTQLHLQGSTWLRPTNTGGDGGWTGYDATGPEPLYAYNRCCPLIVASSGVTYAELDPGSPFLLDPYRNGVFLDVSPQTMYPITRGKLFYTSDLYNTFGNTGWTCVDPEPGSASNTALSIWPARVFPNGGGAVYYVGMSDGLYQINVPANPNLVLGCAPNMTAAGITLLYRIFSPVKGITEDPAQPCLIYIEQPASAVPATRVVRLQGSPSPTLGCTGWDAGTGIAGTLAANLGDDWPNLIEPHAIAVDPISPALVYLGTVQGLYVGRDTGGSWNWSQSLAVPAVDVTDIRPQLAAGGTNGDLYVATFGRGVYKRIVSGGSASLARPATLGNAITRCQVRPHQAGDEAWQMADVEVELSYNGDHGPASLRPVVTSGGLTSPYFSREVHAVPTGTTTVDLRVTYAAADAPPGLTSDGVRVELADSGGTFLFKDCDLSKTWRRPDARSITLRAALVGGEGVPPEVGVPVTVTLANGRVEYHTTPYNAVFTHGLGITLQAPALLSRYDERWVTHAWSLTNHAELSSAATLAFTLLNDAEAEIRYAAMDQRLLLPMIRR